jgi:hypothetical protein
MAKIRKRKIHWKPSNSYHVAGYKLYWAVGANVNYDSESADIGKRTEIILPDDVPSFPFVDGDIELGVTAVTEKGNESDMSKMSASFEFAVPDAPSELGSEDMEDFFVSHRAEAGSSASETEEGPREGWQT